jgi:hypothetical protein
VLPVGDKKSISRRLKQTTLAAVIGCAKEIQDSSRSTFCFAADVEREVPNMRLRVLSISVLAVFVSLGATSRAEAVPVVTLDISNLGIGTLGVDFDPVTNTITLTEDWTSVMMGSVLISGLDLGVNYTVVKEITNNTGLSWTRLANELLDPAGDQEDIDNDPQPYPAFVPAGFSTSSDIDGLSFAQGSGIPRTSSAFASVFEDELTDARDFLDFFNGTVTDGSSFTVTYGLRDNFGNQPFLLVQRPNAFSRPETTIPEPATMFLVGGGLAAIARRRMKRKQ